MRQCLSLPARATPRRSNRDFEKLTFPFAVITGFEVIPQSSPYLATPMAGSWRMSRVPGSSTIIKDEAYSIEGDVILTLVHPQKGESSENLVEGQNMSAFILGMPQTDKNPLLRC